MTKEQIIKEVSDIYYRICCWDDRSPCDTCKQFEKLKKKIKKEIK